MLRRIENDDGHKKLRFRRLDPQAILEMPPILEFLKETIGKAGFDDTDRAEVLWAIEVEAMKICRKRGAVVANKWLARQIRAWRERAAGI